MKRVAVRILDGFFAGCMLMVNYHPNRNVIRLDKIKNYQPYDVLDAIRASDLATTDQFQEYLVVQESAGSSKYIGVCTQYMVDRY